MNNASKTRANIDRQRKLIEKLKADGHAKRAARSEELLNMYEQSLLTLRECRNTILHQERRRA